MHVLIFDNGILTFDNGDVSLYLSIEHLIIGMFRCNFPLNI